MNGTVAVPAVSGDLLDSWKMVAAYLRRDVRTVMRWERVRALPVHRVPGGGKPGVYALKSELDGWLANEGPSFVEHGEVAGSHPKTPSVAVLPFVNFSGDKESEYFSDGLADEIITALARVQGLRVTARTSSFAFRGKDRDVRSIGAALGVSTLLEGSVQRSAGRLRVSVQLVETRDGFHLWSELYDRELADVFAIQDEISNAVVAALKVRLVPLPASSRRVASLDAYDHWLKGRHCQQQEKLEALAESKVYFEQAIAIDPSFPQPYIDLAMLGRTAAQFGTARPKDVAAEGRAAIAKALELDDSLGEAYALSGTYRAWLDFDWEGAEADFERARTLTPASPAVYWLRAVSSLVPTSRLVEAELDLDRAIQLDPLSPHAYILLGKVLLWARQFDHAQASMETAVELRPDYAVAHWFRGAALWFQGRKEEALKLWQTSMRKVGRNPSMLGAIGMGLGYLGRHAEARAVLEQLDGFERETYVSPLSHAQVHLGLGEIDAVFHWLDRAVDERDPHILDLPCKPIWDGLRPDPRFAALLRRMHLAAYPAPV